MLSSRAIVIFITFLAGTVAANTQAQDDASVVQNLDVMSHFRAWMDHHGKKYDSHEETRLRMNIWMENHGKRRDYFVYFHFCNLFHCWAQFLFVCLVKLSHDATCQFCCSL